MTESGKTPLAGTFKKKRANTYALVLAAAGIAYRLKKSEGGWKILVEEADLDRAQSEIAAFRKENPRLPQIEAVEAPTGHSGFAAAAVLAAFYAALGPFDENLSQLFRFGADAGLILGGEWWRCVTALFLHGDFLHLIGNMAGFLVFGTAVCQGAGYGAGWLLILLTGVSGNFLTALVYGGNHLSGGASTAVFGAIGLLGGFRLGPPGLPFSPKNPSAWMVLGVGILFLALLGNSPKADLAAHFFGYASGTVIGLSYGRVFSRPPKRRWQLACLYTAATAVLVSFTYSG
ncbi:MAG: rhomboid family intramembrane serine protease [Deltaproteobacteria bacterium]|nr:rhomboid family intramembrane serine protease [Deltaproteobacteria bacterium]